MDGLGAAEGDPEGRNRPVMGHQGAWATVLLVLLGLGGTAAWAAPDDAPGGSAGLPSPPAGDVVPGLPQPPPPPPAPPQGVTRPVACPPPPPPPPPQPPAPGIVRRRPLAAGTVASPDPSGEPLPRWPAYLQSRVRKAPAEAGAAAEAPPFRRGEAAGALTGEYSGTPCYLSARPGGRRQQDPLVVPNRTRLFLNAYLGGSLSFLPNVGVAVQGGVDRHRDRRLKVSTEAEFTYQFLDDELFIDDGNPAAGNWLQFQGGVKVATNPDARRHWTGRLGGCWFYAGDDPNIVDKEGHYFGVYGGIGFETDLTEGFTMGPELSVMLAIHESGDLVAVPQFNWHFLWNF